ncbi:MAG TPA: hypothetical protein VMW91_05810 [Desulfosporosinus sp.]|nr:hypothetical protein [Desulfosporosinus sp.]
MKWTAKLGSSGACISGAVYKDVHCRQPDKDVRFAGNPALLQENRLSPSLTHDIMR